MGLVKCSGVKMLLVAVNILILLSGGAVVAVGLLVTESFREYPTLLGDTFYSSAPVAIIIIGVLGIMVGLAGVCASVTDSRSVLLAYGVAMICVFIPEFVVGIMALTKVAEVEDFVATEMKKLFIHEVVFSSNYTKKPIFFDAIQKKFNCCGVDAAADYSIVISLTTFPKSCCNATASEVVLHGCQQSKAWPQGCQPPFTDYAEYNTYLVGAVTLSAAAMEAAGCVLLAIGILVQQNFKEYVDLFEEASMAVSIGIIVVGSILIVIGFSGCWGAVSKSRCLLITYGCLMLVIFIAEVVIGILALTMVVDVEAFMATQMTSAFNLEYEDQSSQIFDAMQLQFKCCGVSSPDDYLPIFLNATVPLSCCDPAVLQTAGQATCSQTTAYPIGCQPQFTKFIEDNLYIVGAVAVGLASIELLSIFFAFCLAQKYKQ